MASKAQASKKAQVEADEAMPKAEVEVDSGEEEAGVDEQAESKWRAELVQKESELGDWQAELEDWEIRLDARDAQLKEREQSLQASESPVSIPALDPVDEERARVMMRTWEQRGKPEWAIEIRECLRRGEMPPNRLLSVGSVKPETDAKVSEKDIPPRAGKGATKKAWKAFAMLVTTTDESVLERMSRDDIVNLLESKEIIPKETEQDEQ